MECQEFVSAVDSFYSSFIEVNFSASFGSQSNDHRQRIRMSLYSHILKMGHDEPSILDLDLIPETSIYSCSISHTQGLGGYAITKLPNHIGIDIEVSSRITPELLRRVCSEEEFNSCPEPSILWSAKEATFKANPEISLLKDAIVTDWKDRGQFYEFEARNMSTLGWAAKDSKGHTMALAIRTEV
jgi:hypothetical protein